MAVELAARGFSTIDGLDASARMIAEARAKGIYRDLRGGDVRDPAAVEPGRYDAAIAVGVFGGGHVGPEDLECFARPVRAGGAIVLFANSSPTAFPGSRTTTRFTFTVWRRTRCGP